MSWLDGVEGTCVLVAVLFFVVLQVASLPGNWLILATVAAARWLRGPESLYGAPALVTLLSLAITGELLELLAGAAGARSAGGSLWGSAGALLLGGAGGIAGTFLIPVPLVGSIFGAAAGSAVGAVLGEKLAGRDLDPALASGRGAFFGRLAGTVLKIFVAVALGIVVAFATFL